MDTDQLIVRYPALESCRGDIDNAIRELDTAFSGGGRLYVCGNGGSAADSAHIVGELAKGFLKKRPVSPELAYRLRQIAPEEGALLAGKLQGGLPAFNLCENSALSTAVANDLAGDMIYAQQLSAYARAGDVLLGITTSGNAANIRLAAITARALGMTVIGLTGETGGRLASYCDICIKVPERETYKVQELHLPVYHCLCAAIEERFFEE